MGRALAASLGWSSLPGDALVVAARALTTAASHPALHVVGESGHVTYFTEGPPEKLIADAAALEETMWPAVARVIASQATIGAPVVIDWWLLSPQRVHALNDGRVASLWLTIDGAVLDARERSNTEWRAGSTNPERMLANFMVRSRWRDEVIATQARASGLPMLHVSGTETIEELAEAARRLLGLHDQATA